MPIMDQKSSSADELLTLKTSDVFKHKPLSKKQKRKEIAGFADSFRPGGRRKPGKRNRKRPLQYEFKLSQLLASAAESATAADGLRALACLRRQPPSSQWRGYAAVPPGSLIENVCREFQRGTSIPLEIPFAHLLAYVGGYLCRHDVHLFKGDDRVDPALWMILLANSGAGKTWVTKRIRDGCRIEDCEIDGMSGVASAAALFQKVLQQPTGLWLHDEFGQFVARLDKNLQDTEMKEYVLKLYDGDGLTRSTKKDGERDTGPTRICVLGMSQHVTWHEMVPPRAMLDGTAQRFSYLIVRDDPRRDYRDFADWSVDATGWAEQWQACVRSIQPCYRTSEEAMSIYRQAFRDLASEQLPQSFYRRLMFASHRMALIYHVLLGDPSPVLTAADYGWALRLSRMFIEDCIGVVGENSLSELQRAMHKAQEIADRMQAKGQPLKPRDLIGNMRSIKTVSEAEGLMRLIKAVPPDAKFGSVQR